jgi:hypothetical protein
MSEPNDISQVMTAKDSPDTLSRAFAYFVRHPNVYCFGGTGLLALTFRLYLAEWHIADLLIAAFIIIGWPFMEWRLHISLLHMKPTTLFGKPFYPDVARKHREHHMEPWRMDILFLMSYVLLAIPVVFIIANLLFDFRQALTVCFVGYLMTVFYEWNHFITHTRVQAKSRWFKRIFLNHRMHHFKSERYWYDFSAPWVDEYYGTAPDLSTVESSENCKTLGVELEE